MSDSFDPGRLWEAAERRSRERIFTNPRRSGKSHISEMLAEELRKRGHAVYNVGAEQHIDDADVITLYECKIDGVMQLPHGHWVPEDQHLPAQPGWWSKPHYRQVLCGPVAEALENCPPLKDVRG